MEIKNAKMVFDSKRFIGAKPAYQNSIALASKEKGHRFLVNMNKRMKDGEISALDIRQARSVRKGLNDAIKTVQEHGAQSVQNERLVGLKTVASRLDETMDKIMLTRANKGYLDVIKEYVSALLSKIKEFTVAVGNILKTVGGLLKDIANKLFEGIKAVFNWLKEHPAVATLLVACILSGVGYGIYSVGYKSAIAAGAQIATSATQSATISPVVETVAGAAANTAKAAPVVENVVKTVPVVETIKQTVPVVAQKAKSCVCNYSNPFAQKQCLRACGA